MRDCWCLHRELASGYLFTESLDRSFNIDVLGGTVVSDQAWQNSFHVVIGASEAAAVSGAIARLAGVRYVFIPEGPHALVWTHAEQVNQALLDFLCDH